MMTQTRLETNFTRLLEQCKSFANNGRITEWRFEKYVVTLEELLLELKSCSMKPEKDILDEYTRSVTFLKGLIVTEKLASATDKVVASQFLSPCSSPYGDTVSTEIRHKVAAQYTNQVRDELMKNKPMTPNTSEEKEKSKEFDNPISILRQRKTELLGPSINSNASPVRDFDAVMANEQQTQEEITNDLLSLTRALKEQSASTNAIIRKDMHTLEKSNNLAETNQTNLQLQTEKLKERSGFCKRCWIWLFLLLVCMTFIAMVIFMRLFKKKNHS